jgi:hypothetical protein
VLYSLQNTRRSVDIKTPKPDANKSLAFEPREVQDLVLDEQLG